MIILCVYCSYSPDSILFCCNRFFACIPIFWALKKGRFYKIETWEKTGFWLNWKKVSIVELFAISLLVSFSNDVVLLFLLPFIYFCSITQVIEPLVHWSHRYFTYQTRPRRLAPTSARSRYIRYMYLYFAYICVYITYPYNQGVINRIIVYCTLHKWVRDR